MSEYRQEVPKDAGYVQSGRTVWVITPFGTVLAERWDSVYVGQPDIWVPVPTYVEGDLP